MASRTSRINRYKLNAIFNGDTVVHTTYKSDLGAKQRRVEVKTTWRREKELGSGAFGVVWREREEGSGELRAVKTVPRLQLNVREMEALVELQDHPDLFILFLGWFEDPHAIYIAMEYIEHGDLGQYIKEDWAKAKTEVKEITSQILEGLVILHEREICHRDLKPQNILIASPSPIWVKITDFGISKSGIGTSLKTSCGTVCYQAPEQLGLLPKKFKTRDSYTKVIDLWALGAVVHEILTSEIPFLDMDQGTDSMNFVSDLYITGDIIPTIDMELLFSYCHGLNAFPSESLEKNGVSKEGMGFVKSLLTANPSDRVSATDALKSLWLIGAGSSSEITETNDYIRLETTTDVLGSLQLETSEQIHPGIDCELLRSQFQLLEVHFNTKDINRLFAQEDQATIIDILYSPTTEFIWDLQSKAVSMGYLEVVKVLLKVIDDINFQPKDFPLLQLAARNGQVAVMELLLNHGADINATANQERGQTALQMAAGGGHLDAMKLLLDRGADINPTPVDIGDWTALQAAAEGGHLDATKLLLDRGADINAAPASYDGRTALQAAAGSGHLDTVKLLIDRGADINAVPASHNGRTALQAAAGGGHLNAIKLLLDKGADVNAALASHNGRTALQAAAEGKHLDAMTLLLDRGADVNSAPAEVYGRTALQTAAEAGYLGGMKLLLDRGADTNATSAEVFGRTALQAAAGAGHLVAVHMLLDNGAYIDGVAISLAREHPATLALLERHNVVL